MNNRRKELMLASAREYCKCVVEGKTLRYNNIVQNGNFASNSNWSIVNASNITFTNNTLSCQNAFTSAGVGLNPTTPITIVAGHKYFANFDYNFDSNIGNNFVIAMTCFNANAINITCDSKWHNFSIVQTATQGNVVFYIRPTQTTGNLLQFRNYMIIDLTALGLDSITTADQFFATDLGKYIAKGNYLPYETEGKFINATSPIYFKGRNMLSLARTQGTQSGYANTTPRDFKENEYYLGLTMNNYYNDYTTYFEISREKVVMETSGSGYGVAFPIKVKPNTNYTLRFNSTDNRYRIGWYNELGVFLSYSDNITGNFTSPNNAYWCVVVLAPTVNVRTTYTDIIFCEASDYQSKYEPYCSTQVFENGLTLQKGDKYKSWNGELKRTFGEIDLSTLTWLNNDDSLYALLPSGFKTFEYNDTQTIIAEKYPTGTNNGQIYITNVGGVGYCIRIEGGYTLGITPSGKALCEILAPQIIDNFEQSFDVCFNDTSMWKDSAYTNLKEYRKSFRAYAPILEISNDDEYHYPQRESFGDLRDENYGYFFDTTNGILWMKMPASEWESGNGLTYKFTATSVPTRMVSRRTINVESENEIDLDFTKE